jgi:hypothetical protein
VERKGAFPRRAYVEDMRGNGAYLRMTWHPDGRQFVVSHWHDEVCIAATRVPVEAVPELVTLFVNGLADTAGTVGSVSGSDRARLSSLLQRLQGWLRRSA